MEPTDRQLLERFLQDREESAFEAIVQRYSPMVMGVCQRVTGNTHDAEDAFQAAFNPGLIRFIYYHRTTSAPV